MIKVMSGTLYLIRGIPGSGKSTKAKSMADYVLISTDDIDIIPDFVIDYKAKIVTYEGKKYWQLYNEVSADDFMVNRYTGDYDFNRFKLGYCHTCCLRYTEFLMDLIDSGDYNADIELDNRIMVANTFTRKKEMKPYYELANDYGWNVKEIIMKTNYGSIHNVPKEKIKSMKDRFEY